LSRECLPKQVDFGPHTAIFDAYAIAVTMFYNLENPQYPGITFRIDRLGNLRCAWVLASLANVMGQQS
jgi:hypothetical protein